MAKTNVTLKGRVNRKRTNINLSNFFIKPGCKNTATITLFSGERNEHVSAVIKNSDSVSALLQDAADKARRMHVRDQTIDLIQFEVVEEYMEVR